MSSHRVALAVAILECTSLLVQAAAQDPRAVLDRLGDAQFETLRGTIRLEQGPAATMGPPTTPEAIAVTLVHVVLATPNRFQVVMTAPTPQGDGECQSNGEQATYISSMLGQVAVTGAPASFADIDARDLMLTGAGASMLVPTVLGLSHPLLDVMIAPGGAEARLAAPQEVAGVPCDIVELRGGSGGAPIEMRLAIDAEGFLRSVSVEMPGERPIHLTESFTALEVDGPLRETDFSDPIPANMEQVPVLDPERVRTSPSEM